MKRTYVVNVLFLYSLTVFVAGIISKSDHLLQVKVHVDNITLKWPQKQVNGSNYDCKIFYQVMGTKFHSVISLPDNATEASVSSASYSGMLFLIRLFRNDSIISTRYVRAACGKFTALSKGSVVDLVSPNYPEMSNKGMVCGWTYKSDDKSWFKITNNDIYLPDDSCHSYLDFNGPNTLCNTSSIHDLYYVTSCELLVTFVTRSTGGRFNISIEAIQSFKAPEDINAEGISNIIRVSWMENNSTMKNNRVTYIIRYQVLPAYNISEISLPSNATHFDIDVEHHIGQLYNISLAIRMDNWESQPTGYISHRADCEETHTLRQGQAVKFYSPNFPDPVRRGVLCSWTLNASHGSYIKMSKVSNDSGLFDSLLDGVLSVTTPDNMTYPLSNPHPLIVKTPLTKVELKTGRFVYPAFEIVAKAVPPPTNPPRNLKVSVTKKSLDITWKTPTVRSDDIKKYILIFDIHPDILNKEVLINSSSDTFPLQYTGYEGRMYTISMASVTEGGRSYPSSPIFVRTRCGTVRTLKHGETMLIMSPRGRDGLYPPDVVCKWQVNTADYLWLSVTLSNFKLEHSAGCDADYVEFVGTRKCGQNIDFRMLFQTNSIEIIFASNAKIQDKGFIASVKASAPTPARPTDILVTPSIYGLAVTWNPPKNNPDYVTGYRISYQPCISNDSNVIMAADNNAPELSLNPQSRVDVQQKSIPKGTNIFFINTQGHVGVLFQIWIESIGESSDSEPTDVLSVRAQCGETLSINNITKYISSLRYPEFDDNDVHCVYHVDGNGELMTLTILNLMFQKNRSDMSSCLSGFLMVDEVTKLCTPDGDNRTFHGYKFKIVYQSIPKLSKFLLKMSLSKQKLRVNKEETGINRSTSCRSNINHLLVIALLLSIYFLRCKLYPIILQVRDGLQVLH